MNIDPPPVTRLPNRLSFGILLAAGLGATACQSTQPPELSQGEADASVDRASDASDAVSDAAVPGPITVTPSKIKVGETAVLAWEVGIEAAYCQINQGFGGVSFNSEALVSPTRTMTYTLSCPGGAAVEHSVTLEVQDADPQAPCGLQGDDVFTHDHSPHVYEEGSVPDHATVLLRAYGSSQACAVRCSENWMTPSIVDGDEIVTLPAVITSTMALEIELQDSNLNEVRSGWCLLTTEGGDPRIEVTIQPAPAT